MKLKVVLSAAAAICLGVSAAIAAGEPQVVRQEEMKKVGGAMGALGAIAKGEKPYDAAAVTAALTTLAEVSKTFPDHFPAGSETGMDSEAAPAIWQNMDDFKAKFKEKYKVDVQIYAPYVYDALNVMVAAMEKAGSSDPAKYLPVLAKTTYKGVTGTIAFDSEGNLKHPTFTVYQVKDNKWQPVSVAGGKP